MKTVSLGDIFTKKEFDEYIKHRDSERLLKEIIEPNIDRISKSAGTAMFPRYVMYLAEYALTLLDKKKGSQN